MPARPAHSPARRTLLHSAWAAPLVVAATAAPAFATSGSSVVLTLKLTFSYTSTGAPDKATFSFTATENGLPVTDTAELVFTNTTLGTTTSTPVTVTNGSGTRVMTFTEYVSYSSQNDVVKLAYHGASSPTVVLTAFS